MQSRAHTGALTRQGAREQVGRAGVLKVATALAVIALAGPVTRIDFQHFYGQTAGDVCTQLGAAAALVLSVLHELRAWMNVSGCGGILSYWRTPSGAEVDFVWTRASRAVGIEVKSGTRWRREDGVALKQMLGDGTVRRGFGVYLGAQPLKDGAVEVLPLPSFLDRMYAGKVLSA